MNTKLLLKRIIAHIIDGIILCVFGVLLLVILVALKRIELLSVEAVKILYVVGFVVVGFLYFFQEGPLGKGQTIGKRALKIKVISEDGRAPSYKQVIIRNLLRVWDAMFFYGIGISRISRSEKGQRFGDEIAKTMVVESSRGLPKIWILLIVITVVVVGLLLYQQLQAPEEEPVGGEQPPAEEGQPSGEEAELPQEEAQPPADETANWKTYRNAEYKFEVRYPEEWEILHEGYYRTEIPYEVSFTPKDLKGPYAAPISIMIHTKSIEGASKTSGYEELKSEKGIVVDNINSKEQIRTGPEGEFMVVLVPKKEELTYELRYNNPKFKNIFNQILSTFRFLE